MLTPISELLLLVTQEFCRLKAADTVRAEWVPGAVKSDVINCPTDAEHQQCRRRLSHLVVYVPPGQPSDFLWTWYGECLISPKALDVLTRNELTGFDARPVVALFRSSTATAPAMFELRPTGWGGIAPEGSGITMTDYCEICGHTHYTGFTRPDLLIDENQWDGSDFFIVWPLPAFILVSPRAREAIQRSELRGAAFELVRDMKCKSGAGLAPGRVEFWFPEAKVKWLKARYDGIE